MCNNFHTIIGLVRFGLFYGISTSEGHLMLTKFLNKFILNGYSIFFYKHILLFKPQTLTLARWAVGEDPSNQLACHVKPQHLYDCPNPIVLIANPNLLFIIYLLQGGLNDLGMTRNVQLNFQFWSSGGMWSTSL